MAIRIFTPDTFIVYNNGRPPCPVSWAQKELVDALDSGNVARAVELRKLSAEQRADILEQFLDNPASQMNPFFPADFKEHLIGADTIREALDGACLQTAHLIKAELASIDWSDPSKVDIAEQNDDIYNALYDLAGYPRFMDDFMASKIEQNIDPNSVTVQEIAQALRNEFRDDLYGFHIERQLCSWFQRGHEVEEIKESFYEAIKSLPQSRQRMLEVTPVHIAAYLDKFPFSRSSDTCGFYSSGICRNIALRCRWGDEISWDLKVVNEEIVHAIDDAVKFSQPGRIIDRLCENKDNEVFIDGLLPDKQSLSQYYNNSLHETGSEKVAKCSYLMEALANIVVAIDAGIIDLQKLEDKIPQLSISYLHFIEREERYIETLRYG